MKGEKTKKGKVQLKMMTVLTKIYPDVSGKVFLGKYLQFYSKQTTKVDNG